MKVSFPYPLTSAYKDILLLLLLQLLLLLAAVLPWESGMDQLDWSWRSS